MPGLTKTQIIGLIGFLLILISIPISFSLAKRSQIFRSRASELKTTATTTGTVSGTVTKSREVPASSPLTDLQKLLQGESPTPDSTTNPSISPTPTSEVSLAFGPTLNLKVSIEGRPEAKQSDRIFIGIASNSTAPPTYILTFTIDMPDSGIFKGISLAGLNPGSQYTAFIKGTSQIDVSSTFTMDPTESNLNNDQPITLISGDLNEDNTINTTDYSLAQNLYGTTSSSSNWNARADFNKDNIINNYDLAIISKNIGKAGASGSWISSPRPSTQSASLTTKPGVGGPPTNFGDLLLSSSPSASPTEPSNNTSNSSSYWLRVP